MNKKEVIEELSMRIRSIQILDGLDSHNDYSNGKGMAYSNAIELIEQIDESKKAELTPKQAERFELLMSDDEYKPYLCAILCEYDDKDAPLIARAYLDGYTIKKEPRYLVKLAPWDDEGYLNAYEGDSFPKHYTMGSIKPETDYKFEFTEAEIKAIDKRYWPFAEKVEEE